MSLFSAITGKKQSKGGQLLERLGGAERLEDRREAIAEFKDLTSRQPVRLVFEGGIGVLLNLLRGEDTDTHRDALETLVNLLDRDVPKEQPEAAQVAATHNCGVLLSHPEKIGVILGAAENSDMYVRYHATQLLMRQLSSPEGATRRRDTIFVGESVARADARFGASSTPLWPPPLAIRSLAAVALAIAQMDQAWAADLHSEAAEVAPAYAAAQNATAVAAQPGECEPLSACEPCVDEDLDQTYCSTSGLKQEVRCVASANATGPTYVTMFRSCTDAPNDAFATFCRFELAMVLLFIVSYAFVARRKRRLLAIQHHRIAQYLS